MARLVRARFEFEAARGETDLVRREGREYEKPNSVLPLSRRMGHLFCLLHLYRAADGGFARQRSSDEEFAEPGQIDLSGKKRVGLFCFSSAAGFAGGR